MDLQEKKNVDEIINHYLKKNYNDFIKEFDEKLFDLDHLDSFKKNDLEQFSSETVKNKPIKKLMHEQHDKNCPLKKSLKIKNK
jgi:hypothetical protein